MIGSTAAWFAVGQGVERVRHLRVAAAADLRYAMEDLVRVFRQRHPDVAVEVVYGSSGSLYAQILNRAPFDVFFSADAEYPRRLAAQGLALPGSRPFLYGVGFIVLWARRESSVDVERLGMTVLQDPSVRRIAIANPQHAPYGRAAVAALKYFGMYDAVVRKLVYGENISQAAQFVQSGAADIGILALSLALAPALRDTGRYWKIPPVAYPPIEQAGMILPWAQDPAAAQAFRDFVLSAEGQAILARYGFEKPGGRKFSDEVIRQPDRTVQPMGR
ncbi:MAG: molybdate ABC transporter substrate-binding protein [Acidobacteria bacterium]|nr:molybdate ABC transporter substrate-binding protein [Acidobacteriota bacterium]MDW7984163.1 molybdate ABC transporter substrate-binding protein [Acidobacteriota bacterium]